MPIVFDDGGLGSAFHLRVTPTHIVIGRDGRIQYVGHLADTALDRALMASRSPSALGPQAAAAGASSSPIAVGDPLPRRSLLTLDGTYFELRHRAPSQITALVFISPWCESYLATTRPELSANCRQTREQVSSSAAEPGVRWIGIASGLWANSQDLRKYQTEYKVPIPLTLDASGEVFRAFRVNNVPTILIADAEGRIVRRIEAGETWNIAALRAVSLSKIRRHITPRETRSPQFPIGIRSSDDRRHAPDGSVDY
jgi:peroxiredoxin